LDQFQWTTSRSDWQTQAKQGIAAAAAAAVQTNSTIVAHKERNIMFMHVGKTGGATLRTSLLKYGCEVLIWNSELCLKNLFGNNQTESKLSSLTNGIHHNQKRYRRVQRAITTDFMFAIREPVSRFESWFRNQSPHNCIDSKKENKCKRRREAMIQNPNSHPRRFFYDCFQKVEEMAQALDPTYVYGNQIMNVSDCRALLREAFEIVGVSKNYGHLSAGYRFYTQQAQLEKHNKTVWAIRTEYLWQDVRRIDQAVGGTGDFGHLEGVKNSHFSERFPDKTGLSESSSHLVCCALWPEMLAYRDIVERAANLNTTEKRETYQLTWHRCNVTSWEILEERCSQL
jgi:hypothetical protein